jgi:hypothetical protein
MTKKKDRPAKHDPKSARRCTGKWVERDGEVRGLKRTEDFDEHRVRRPRTPKTGTSE